MNIKIILIVLIFSLKNTVAFAHSPLKVVSPKNNEILSQAPEQITMIFKSEAKLIKITLEKQKNIKQDSMISNFFSEGNGENIKIKENALMQISKKHSIDLPKLTSGKYLFHWRAMSKDGHVIKGNLKFNIK